MRAAVLLAPGKLEITEVDTPRPGEGEILLEVAACGICGTDLHSIAGNNPLVRYPAIPGHEFVGTVVETGTAVKRLAAGDRVAVDPSRSCGRCYYCRSGWPNLCPAKGGHGSRVPGGFAEYVVVRDEACVSLDAATSFVRAAFAEPLACVLHGMDRLGPLLGRRALVYGAGPIGLLAATLLTQGGAPVQVVERSELRRDFAGRLGLESAADAAQFDVPEGWDVVVDATGVPAAIEEAISNVRRSGTMLLLGVAPPGERAGFEPFRINWHEITMIGSMAIRHSFERAVDLLGQVRLPIEEMVTHRFGLSGLHRGIDHVRERTAVKVLIEPQRADT